MKDTHPSPRTGKQVKDQYYFPMPGMEIAWMAGVFEDDHFSVMTTMPNMWMEKIHPRMPVVLHPDELDSGLYGDYPAFSDRENMRLESSKVAA
jgi:putative SOS response-associated peptidase YedK